MEGAEDGTTGTEGEMTTIGIVGTMMSESGSVEGQDQGLLTATGTEVTNDSGTMRAVIGDRRFRLGYVYFRTLDLDYFVQEKLYITYYIQRSFPVCSKPAKEHYTHRYRVSFGTSTSSKHPNH